MLLWGWRGSPGNPELVSHDQAHELLRNVRASSNMSLEARKSFLHNELQALDCLDGRIEELAEEQSERLVAAHERFSSLMDKKRFQVVYPVLPMDLIGIYTLLPEGPA